MIATIKGLEEVSQKSLQRKKNDVSSIFLFFLLDIVLRKKLYKNHNAILNRFNQKLHKFGFLSYMAWSDTFLIFVRIQI